MSTRSRNIAHAEGAPLRGAREHSRSAQRPRRAWLRCLPPLARHVAGTMPWVTLITGCLAGLIYLVIMAYVAESAHWSLTQGMVRVAFLPAVAALAFVVRAPFRPLTQTTPVPVWVVPAGYVLLAAPVLAVTCWAQLGIIAHTSPHHSASTGIAVYPLVAQLAGWCAVTVAVAAWADRSRYADHGGAVAAPVTFAAVACAWYLPASARFLVEPPASAHDVTIAWYCIAAAALAVTWVAMRDQWHRYARSRRSVPRAPG